MKFDVIIIGAGLGGLTAGAKLSREGKKVLIIEQHSKPGGCATTFKRGDFTLEVGLHEMDGPSPRDMKMRIFTELDVFKHIEFVNIPEFYHFINDRVNITIPHNPQEAKNILIEKFPGESAGIEAFYDHIINSERNVPGKEPERDISLGEFLDSIITNEGLKLILLGNLGYFNDDPYSISLAYYSIAQRSYFNYGASFIKGGSQKLSDHLANYIKNHGGDILVNHLVTGIRTENNRLTCVEYKEKSKSSEKLVVKGDEIILNAALPNIVELLPSAYGSVLKDEIRKQRPGASLLTIYFGFRCNLKKIGNQHYSTFIFDSSVKSQSDILKNNKADFSKRSFTFVDYGQIDSDLAAEGKSVGAICCIDYLTDWESLSAKEYAERKEAVTKIFISRLETLLPGIGAEIEYCEAGTSETIKRYTLNPEGAVYGFAKTPGSPVINMSYLPDNLHIASAWGKTGGGFSGVIYSGYLCACNILRKRKIS